MHHCWLKVLGDFRRVMLGVSVLSRKRKEREANNSTYQLLRLLTTTQKP
jgi:hypothetical protein